MVHDVSPAGQQLRHGSSGALGRADARYPATDRARYRRGAEDRRQRAVRAALVNVNASTVIPAARTSAVAAARQVVADYFELTKPKVQTLLLFTTVSSME